MMLTLMLMILLPTICTAADVDKTENDKPKSEELPNAMRAGTGVGKRICMSHVLDTEERINRYLIAYTKEFNRVKDQDFVYWTDESYQNSQRIEVAWARE